MRAMDTEDLRAEFSRIRFAVEDFRSAVRDRLDELGYNYLTGYYKNGVSRDEIDELVNLENYEF